jgi:hypothetical protein
MHFLGRTRVALDIAEHGDVSQFVFEPTGVDPHVVEDAWRSMFDALAQVLGAPSATARSSPS